jgi:hypothetical protein
MDPEFIAIELLLTKRPNDDDSHRGYLEHNILHSCGEVCLGGAMANKRQCLPKACPVVR